MTAERDGDQTYGLITTRYGFTDGKAQTAKDEIREGKNLGKANQTSPVGQAVLEAKATWQQKIDRKGYSQDPSGDESAAKRKLLPMLAETYEDFAGKIRTDVDWWMQPKWDGHRCMVHITRDEVKLVSRGGEQIDTMPHVTRAYLPLRQTSLVREFKHIIVDGELFSQDMDFEELSGAIRGEAKDDKRAIAQFDMSHHPYDLYIPELSQMKFSERFRHLLDLLEVIERHHIVVTPTMPCSGPDALFAFRDKCIKEFQEGCMLRLDLPYDPNKRSKSLYKCKVWQEAEFKVIDVEAGRGTFKNKAVFICQVGKDKIIRATAPGTNADKERYLRDGKKYIGQMLTLKYFCYTRKGVPKQPVAKGFRLAHE